MTDLTHLNAIELRLSHERDRLAKAKTDSERNIRQTWISQIEKERESELRFLGLQDSPLPDLTDDELLAELAS